MATRGKSINLFLMDGEPSGRIKCTLANWTGIAYKIPRTALDLCKERDDLRQSGIYFLFGTSDQTGNSVVYVGQAGARKNGEGVELYQKHRDIIDLILMDLHMPVMNGYEAAENIRSISSQVPIIAMTADVILGVRDKCEQSGIFHYISKPINPDHFIQTIKDIILENEPNIEPDTAVLDRQLGFKNMGGNEELYNQVLIEYRNENQDTLEKLEAAVREKRYTEATQIVHKVKSSSGSIGAKSLQAVAALLQKALNEEKEDEIVPLQDRFSKLLGKLLEELK